MSACWAPSDSSGPVSCVPQKTSPREPGAESTLGCALAPPRRRNAPLRRRLGRAGGGVPSLPCSERSSLHGSDSFRLLDELVEIERLPDEATRAARCRLAPRRLVHLAAEHQDGNRSGAVLFLDPAQHLPAV